MMNKKIILVDFGYFLHSSIHFKNKCLKENQLALPSSYTAFSKILSCIKKIGLNYNDKVIIAVDSKYGSWRKKEDIHYKANRKEKRESQSYFVNWEKEFKEQERLLEKIKLFTPFLVLRIKYVEADDIISYIVRKYKDIECIIVATDKDYNQLLVYDNVKIFNPMNKKYRILDKDREKERKKAYDSLMKKILGKEVSDNLTEDILSEEDYKRRKLIVSLLTLPKNIEKIIEKVINREMTKQEKKFVLSHFSNGIKKQLVNIYSKKNVVSYDKCKNGKKKKRRKKNETIKSRKN